MSFINTFITLVNMSISAGWIIIAVFLIRLIFRKLPKKAHMFFWLLISVRLLCPISFSSNLSLLPNERTIEIHPAQEPEGMVEADRTQDARRNITASIQLQTTDDENMLNGKIQLTGTEEKVNEILFFLEAAWLIGFTGMVLFGIFSSYRLKRRLRASVCIERNIYRCDDISVPFVFGIQKPAIYVPSGLSSTVYPYAVLHEETHIRRKDYVWKILGYMVLALHWFNPLVWISYYVFNKDIELLCDECVVKKLPTASRAAYAEALVHCAVRQRKIAVYPLTFAKGDIMQRVKRIMKYKKTPAWSILISAGVCIGLAICFLTNPLGDKTNADNENPAVETVILQAKNTEQEKILISNTTRIETPDYSLDVPQLWIDRVYCYLENDTLLFAAKQCVDCGESGILCSISKYGDTEYASELLEVIGGRLLISKNAGYLVRFMTDVEYSYENESAYNELIDALPSIDVLTESMVFK